MINKDGIKKPMSVKGPDLKLCISFMQTQNNKIQKATDKIGKTFTEVVGNTINVVFGDTSFLVNFTGKAEPATLRRRSDGGIEVVNESKTERTDEGKSKD